MAGWLAGTSRKYQYQTNTHARLAKPNATNEPRHVTRAISHATIGGVTALPNRANAWVMPCAKPRRPGGVHACIARGATGKVAPSPTPSRSRARNRVVRLPTSPVRIVAVAQIRPQRNKVDLGPNRSPIQPPRI